MVKKKKGFTIVELVIVIAVIAILAAVLIPTFATIINKANQSADIQLVRNLNSAIVDGIYVENELDTAENIRDHLAKNGYGLEDLVTKNSDNVLALNKTTKKVEAINLDDFGASDNTPYYDNEVVDGYIIFSVIGNSTAEGFFDLRNFPSNTDSASVSTHAKAIATIANDPYLTTLENHVTSALNKIDNKFRSAVADVINKTIYVIGEYMYVFNVVGSEVEAIKVGDGWDIRAQFLEDGTELNGFRPYVVFNSDVKEFNVDPLMVPRSGLYVVIPNHVNVTGTKQENSEDLPTFAGNISSNIIPKNKIKSINAVKELVEQFSDVELIEYGQDQVYTSDSKNNLAKAVELAERIIATKTEAGDSDPAARIVVNSNVTVSSNITIPKGITVEIPFAIGDYIAKEIMTFEGGDALGRRALGEAYPANDSENLNKADKDKLYYLCGEGPGGGYDSGILPLLEKLNEEGIDTSNYKQSVAIFEASRNIAQQSKQSKYSLTINNGAELKLYGRVRIGGVIGYPDASGYQGHTSGQYAQINNNGKIVVENGGVLDVWGFIKGSTSAQVVANEGGLIYEPFVITDYLDGWPTLSLYPLLEFIMGDMAMGLYNSPFMRYTVMNIQTKCTINYGAALYVRANLLVFGMLYCRTDAPMITSKGGGFDPYYGTYKSREEMLADGYKQQETINDNGETEYSYYNYDDNDSYYDVSTTNGALVLSEGASIVNEYSSKDVKISQANSEDYEWNTVSNRNSLAGDVGINTITINGNVETYGIRLDLLGMGELTTVDTSNCILPIGYYYNFVVAKDAHLTMNHGNRYALMPGATLTVKEGGNLTITDGAALYVMDSYEASEYFRNLDKYITPMGAVVNEENGMLSLIPAEATEEELIEAGALIGDLVAGVTGSKLAPKALSFDIAQKYYPSAKLLKANGFEASAIFTVNGTLIVEGPWQDENEYWHNGGTIGGTVNATSDKTVINLEEEAGLGGFVYLGGPVTPLMFAMFGQQVLAGFDKYDSYDFYALAEIVPSMAFFATTYHNCVFRLIGADGEEIYLEDYYNDNYGFHVNLGGVEETFYTVEYFFTAMVQLIGQGGFKADFGGEIWDAYPDIDEESRQHKMIGYLTLKQALTITMESGTANATRENNPSYVGSVELDTDTSTLTIIATKVSTGTVYYGGNWSIETIKDGATD